MAAEVIGDKTLKDSLGRPVVRLHPDDLGSGTSTVIPPGGGGPVLLPLTDTLDDDTPVVYGITGALPGSTVWINPGAGDTARIRYRVDPATPWVVLYEGAVYFQDILKGRGYEIEFTRTAGGSIDTAWGLR